MIGELGEASKPVGTVGVSRTGEAKEADGPNRVSGTGGLDRLCRMGQTSLQQQQHIYEGSPAEVVLAVTFSLILVPAAGALRRGQPLTLRTLILPFSTLPIRPIIHRHQLGLL